MDRGSVVKSIAGRDKDRYQVVLFCEGDRVLVADGKVRKLASPKHKNVKHIKKIEGFIDLDKIYSDRALKKALTMLDLN